MSERRGWDGDWGGGSRKDARPHANEPSQSRCLRVPAITPAHPRNARARAHTERRTLLKWSISELGAGGDGGDVRKAGLIKTSPTLLALAPPAQPVRP
jgi:hypothetical protein